MLSQLPRIRLQLLMVLVGAVCGLGGVAVARTAAAQAGLPPASPSTITVVGEGDATGAPDVAYITVGVQTRGPTAVQASDENARRMSALLEMLRSRGVPQQDIQTSGLSVSPDYGPIAPQPVPMPGNAPMAVPGPERTGDQASNTVTVTVQQVDRAGALLDAALGSGGNQVGGIRFGLRDSAALKQQALEQATQAARTKAEQLSSKMGLRLVGISSVAEESGSGIYPVAESAVSAVGYAGGAVPIESGSLKVSARVRVAYQFQ
jgi:uncharacterized protein YggE